MLDRIICNDAHEKSQTVTLMRSLWN